MLFCARDYSTICDGLAKLFNADIEDVFLHLSNIHCEKRADYTAKFIKDHLKNHITDIEFYHLSRSISPHKVLYPLGRLLLTENELSLFFREHGIEFSKSGEVGISMFVDDGVTLFHSGLFVPAMDTNSGLPSFDLLKKIDIEHIRILRCAEKEMQKVSVCFSDSMEHILSPGIFGWLKRKIRKPVMAISECIAIATDGRKAQHK